MKYINTLYKGNNDIHVHVTVYKDNEVYTVEPTSKGPALVERLSSFRKLKCISYTLLGILEMSFIKMLSPSWMVLIRGPTVCTCTCISLHAIRVHT